MSAYRYRLILMGAQPSLVGEPVTPTQTVEGTWSKPAPKPVIGRKPALTITGNPKFQRTVS